MSDSSDAAPAADLTRLGDRLAGAGAAFAELRPAVEAGDPWPLSAAYGTEPESDWGPKELLAHTAEMLGFWPAEIETILAGGPEPVPFGRVSTDPARIARIERDRVLPTGELFDRIGVEVGQVRAKLVGLTAGDGSRIGLHPRLAEMTVATIVERFLVGHLEEHVDQLRDVLARRSTGQPG
jgi:hypothetical protein